MKSRIIGVIGGVALAVLMVAAIPNGSEGSPGHKQTRVAALASPSPDLMTIDELWNVGEGQRQSNVQDVVCDCQPTQTLRKYTINGVNYKEVQYPMPGNPYGDIIRYRVTNNNLNLTDGYVYVVRDGVGVPLNYNADGSLG